MKPAFLLCASLILPFTVQSASIAAPRHTGDVVVISTGDRLTPGYRVTIEPDGTLESTLIPFGQKEPLRRTDKMIAINRERFFADLKSAEPLASLPTGAVTGAPAGRSNRRRNTRQPAAVSRSSTRPQIFLEYQGRTSPNLRTVNSTAGRVLYQDVKQVLQVLRLPIPNTP